MSSVKLNKMIEKLQLVNLVPEVSTDEIEISSPRSTDRLCSLPDILSILQVSVYRLLDM